MSDKKKNTPEKKKDSKSKKEDEKENKEMDKELKQSFPASDPPSHTRPGHDRSKDDKS